MQNALKPPTGKMITDFPTAPLAPGLRGAGGGTVEKSLYASHTETLILPQCLLAGACQDMKKIARLLARALLNPRAKPTSAYIVFLSFLRSIQLKHLLHHAFPLITITT